MRNNNFLFKQKNISLLMQTKYYSFLSKSFILLFITIFTWQCKVPIPLKNTNIETSTGKSDVKLITRAPLKNPVERTINQTFTFLNYVFFDEGSSAIPNRYSKLSKNQALKFEIEHLRESDIKVHSGRSELQMNTYHNILNVLGFRMLQNPTTLITLTGSSAGNGAALGKEYAESVKSYLVDVFGVQSSRIAIEGRNEPINHSEEPGSVNYLHLLRAGNRRVDIVSNSVDLLVPLQIIDVQADLLESRVVFSAKSDKHQPLKSWNVQLTDENGISQTFGSYKSEQESILGNQILGNRTKATYKVVMSGKTFSGNVISKKSTLHLVRSPELKEEAFRYSILFDFDVSKTAITNEKFLKEVVTPRINNNSIVIIHGHTDIIGSEDYNMKLSEERALETRNMLEKSVLAAGKTGVEFETTAFGMNADKAPFENNLPEERFYNRTVIIDIVPAK